MNITRITLATPIETINNVKAFFNKNKNFTLKINEIHHNQESNTYWCIINLYYKNKLYISSNGKGTSELFCLASGFGELFERFCSEINIYTNYTLCLKLFDKYKNLQKISAEDAIKDSFCL